MIGKECDGKIHRDSTRQLSSCAPRFKQKPPRRPYSLALSLFESTSVRLFDGRYLQRILNALSVFRLTGDLCGAISFGFIGDAAG